VAIYNYINAEVRSDSLRKTLRVLHFITLGIPCVFQNFSYGCENIVFHSKGRT